MKRSHIALFLALSAGYLGAASAEPLQNGTDTPEKTPTTEADNATSEHRKG